MTIAEVLFAPDRLDHSYCLFLLTLVSPDQSMGASLASYCLTYTTWLALARHVLGLPCLA
jgi:hypothetical protein